MHFVVILIRSLHSSLWLQSWFYRSQTIGYWENHDFCIKREWQLNMTSIVTIKEKYAWRKIAQTWMHIKLTHKGKWLMKKITKFIWKSLTVMEHFKVFSEEVENTVFVSIQELRKQFFYEIPTEVFIWQENTCTFNHIQSNMIESILRDYIQQQVKEKHPQSSWQMSFFTSTIAGVTVNQESILALLTA